MDETAMTGVEKRILLVSRDSSLSLEIDKLLGFNAGIDYELNTVYPFEKALDSIKKTDYTLVIIDLPEGNKCIEAVEKICDLAAGLPIIVLTNSGFRNAALALKRARIILSANQPWMKNFSPKKSFQPWIVSELKMN